MPLTLVPTPLGNLGDVTLRALEALRAADLIVAEDTRVAQRLCRALAIEPGPIVAYHAYSSEARRAEIVERARGRAVVAVSDAGMPGVSDPGSELVRAARAAGVGVDVLPGPCAFVGAAVLSGFPIVGLQFCGFVPRRRGRRDEAFARALAAGHATAWYESPHRVVATLEALAATHPQARLFLVREYTKRFEQQLAGTPAEALAELARPVRGEITLVLAGDPEAAFALDQADAYGDDRDDARDPDAAERGGEADDAPGAGFAGIGFAEGGAGGVGDAEAARGARAAAGFEAAAFDRRIAELRASGASAVAVVKRLRGAWPGDRASLYRRVVALDEAASTAADAREEGPAGPASGSSPA